MPQSSGVRRYGMYMLVAAIVGGATIALRELLALVLREDTPGTYAVSVALATCCGMLMNYLAQARFTFSAAKSDRRWRGLALFLAIAALTALLTVALARLLRYDLAFDVLFGRAGPAVAFACATLVTSIISYNVNARLIFPARGIRGRAPQGMR